MLQYFHKSHVGSPERAKRHALWVTGFGLGAEWYERVVERLWRVDKVASVVYALRPLSTLRVAPSWASLSSEIGAEVRALPQGDTTILGHSFGSIPLVMAVTEKLCIADRMVLIEPTLQSEAFLARWSARNYLRSLAGDSQYVFHNVTAGFRRVHDLRTFPPNLIRKHVAGIEEHRGPITDSLFDTYPTIFPIDWRSFNEPVLIVGGKSTGRASHLVQRLLKRKFRNAQHRLVPRAGHWIFGEADTMMASMLSEFMVG